MIDPASLISLVQVLASSCTACAAVSKLFSSAVGKTAVDVPATVADAASANGADCPPVPPLHCCQACCCASASFLRLLMSVVSSTSPKTTCDRLAKTPISPGSRPATSNAKERASTYRGKPSWPVSMSCTRFAISSAIAAPSSRPPKTLVKGFTAFNCCLVRPIKFPASPMDCSRALIAFELPFSKSGPPWHPGF
jgi:hypothetical protein